MTILAIDCAASLCAACVYDGTARHEMGRAVRDLGKGHAEHLMAVIAEALEQSGKAYADLSGIAVSIGPGSFTGIRVGVSAARGLALALKVPAIGIDCLEALAAGVALDRGDPARPVMAALPAGDGHAFIGIYENFAKPVHHPSRVTLEEAARLARTDAVVLSGSAAASIAALVEGEGVSVFDHRATADIAVYAALAARRGLRGPRPSPLYLREPDAKPQAGFVLLRQAAS